MVSFHCNGCDDVVTKPKLMAHWNRCYAQVDCLDCSKTFNNPGEFKSHTSCVSEAEKYEKSVYKGPKTAPKNHYPPPDSAPAPHPQLSRGSFRGRGRGGYNNGWGQPQVPGTGANGTPLGTPKGSPPPVEVISLPQKRKVDEIEQDTNGVKANGATSDTKTSNDVDSKLMKKSKREKEKKKKNEETAQLTKDDKKEPNENKSAPKAGEEIGVEGKKSKRKEKDAVKEKKSAEVADSSEEKRKERKEKKHRTKKDEESSKGNVEDGSAPSAEDEPGSKLRKEKRKHKEDGKEEKKKSKKRTHDSEEKAEKDTEVNAMDVDVVTESRKRKREINKEEQSQPVLEEKEKKSKKEKKGNKEEKKEKGHKKHRRSTEGAVKTAPLIAVSA